MKRSIWTKLGIIELGALAIVWRSANAAPLVTFESDLDESASAADQSRRRLRRSDDCDREQRSVG